MLYKSPWKISIHIVHVTPWYWVFNLFGNLSKFCCYSSTTDGSRLWISKYILKVKQVILIGYMGFFWQLISTECTSAPGKQICYIYHCIFWLGAGIVLCPHSFHSPSSNYCHWSTSASTGEHCRCSTSDLSHSLDRGPGPVSYGCWLRE